MFARNVVGRDFELYSTECGNPRDVAVTAGEV